MPPRVASYMSSPVITASKNDSLAHVRNLMIRHKIGKVVITDNNEVLGIISKSDFVKIVYNRRRYLKPLNMILAYEIMTSPVFAIQPDKSIKAAAHAMLKRNIGSLLVMSKDGKLVGIITKADLVKAYASRYGGIYRVFDFMISNPPTAHLAHSLYYLVDLIRESDCGKVVVVDGNKPVGVVTKADITFLNMSQLGRRGVKFYKRAGITARGFEGVIRMYTLPLAMDIMTPNPLTVRPDEDLAMAADTMVKNKIGTLPVVDEHDYLIGLITKKDIIKALRKV